jgi:hypothetical protein
MALSGWKLGISVFLALVLTLIFYFLIPIISPGFPTPVITSVQLSGASPMGGGILLFSVDSEIVNKGTGGNVIISTKMVNASRNSIEGISSKNLYMSAGEKRTIRTTVKGPKDSPCLVVVEAERRTAFNTVS